MKMDPVNKQRMITVTFAIAILDGVEMHAMKMLTNVLMEATAALMAVNVLMRKESFYFIVDNLYVTFDFFRLYNI